MSSSRPRVIPVKGPVLPQQTTPEQRFWRQYSSTQLVKEHKAVTHISFNPVYPHDFAVTSSTRVQLFSSRTRQVIKTFSQFKDVVYSASFRSDGKLLVAGDATGLVSVYDSYNSRNLLVSIKASSHPAHVTKFHPIDNKTLFTATDDRIVRMWDISHSYQPTLEFGVVSDYVRSINFIPGAPHLVVTGSYDGMVRIYDSRIQASEPVDVLDHGMPVESGLAISTTQLVTCGGNGFKVWDLSNSRILCERGNFARTVTCLDYIDMPSNVPMSSCLLASSLDGHVKVFDPLDNFSVKFGWKFSSAVLSCALSPGDAQGNKHLVAGLSSGLLVIRTNKKTKKSPTSDTDDGLGLPVMGKPQKSGNFERMMRGSEYKGDEEHIIHFDKSKQQPRLRLFEKNLNEFKWGKALDTAFIPGMAKELTLTVLQELRKRGKIRVALYDRDETSLEPLLNWCLKGIEDVRSAPVVADWIAVVLELYGNSLRKSLVLEEMIVSLRNRVRQEIQKAKEAQKIEGMLQLLAS